MWLTEGLGELQPDVLAFHLALFPPFIIFSALFFLRALLERVSK